MYVQDFIQDFLLGGNVFWNSNIDIRHTFLGGSGGMLPQKIVD